MFVVLPYPRNNPRWGFPQVMLTFYFSGKQYLIFKMEKTYTFHVVLSPRKHLFLFTTCLRHIIWKSGGGEGDMDRQTLDNYIYMWTAHASDT